MKPKFGITIFAFLEILIGSLTSIAVILSLVQGKSAKPLEVLIFVLTTAIVSTLLGFGILKGNLTCYHLLLYFSSIIILSKILIFAKIIAFNGALETTIPSSIKNIISILYHGLLVFFFTRKPIKERFGERRNAIFSLKIPFQK